MVLGLEVALLPGVHTPVVQWRTTGVSTPGDRVIVILNILSMVPLNYMASRIQTVLDYDTKYISCRQQN